MVFSISGRNFSCTVYLWESIEQLYVPLHIVVQLKSDFDKTNCTWFHQNSFDNVVYSLYTNRNVLRKLSLVLLLLLLILLIFFSFLFVRVIDGIILVSMCCVLCNTPFFVGYNYCSNRNQGKGGNSVLSGFELGEKMPYKGTCLFHFLIYYYCIYLMETVFIIWEGLLFILLISVLVLLNPAYL